MYPMNKIKLSWTKLSEWSRNAPDSKEKVLKMFIGEEIESNIYMEEGKRIHEIISTNKLPLIPLIKETAEFEDIQPDKGLWKNYFKCPVNEWCDLSMVADVLDRKEGIVIDWKTGSKSSMEQNKLQVYMYAYGLGKLGIDIKHGVMAHVVEGQDKTIYCSDYTVYKITPDKIALAENYIETVGGEIYQFLQEYKNANKTAF